MTDHKATPEQWADAGMFASDTRACLLELRARVEALEAAAHKHIVETSANILALASRVEALEAVKRPASKVYEISKPLQLTPEQAQHVRDLLAPNSKPTPNSSQIGRSLVKCVALAISGIEYGLERDEEAVNWVSEARAAIREVALWLNEAPLDLYPGDRGIVVNALYDQANL
jgi:hypothetical protein